MKATKKKSDKNVLLRFMNPDRMCCTRGQDSKRHKETGVEKMLPNIKRL